MDVKGLGRWAEVHLCIKQKFISLRCLQFDIPHMSEVSWAWGRNLKVGSWWGPQSWYAQSKLPIPVQPIISASFFSPGWILLHTAHRYTSGPAERSVIVHHSSVGLLKCSGARKPSSTHRIDVLNHNWAVLDTTPSKPQLQQPPNCDLCPRVLSPRGERGLPKRGPS